MSQLTQIEIDMIQEIEKCFYKHLVAGALTEGLLDVERADNCTAGYYATLIFGGGEFRGQARQFSVEFVTPGCLDENSNACVYGAVLLEQDGKVREIELFSYLCPVPRSFPSCQIIGVTEM